MNSDSEHVFSARVEDILTGTLTIFVNEGKAHAKAGGLGNTFGTLQVEVELPDYGARHPSTDVWSSQMTPASIGGYLGYGSVGSQTGGSLTNDEFNWQGQTYTVKALLYNPAQGQLELDLSPALPDQDTVWCWSFTTQIRSNGIMQAWQTHESLSSSRTMSSCGPTTGIRPKRNWKRAGSLL